MRRWAFLTRALSERRWFWELFTMIRKLLLVFIGVFIKDPFLQVHGGGSVLRRGEWRGAGGAGPGRVRPRTTADDTYNDAT